MDYGVRDKIKSDAKQLVDEKFSNMTSFAALGQYFAIPFHILEITNPNMEKK